jgi:hypothetical protein
MNLPALVRSELDDEAVTASVALGGDDALFVTPSRALRYHAEGLLSDESVESYPHGAERIAVSEGRRKATVTLTYGLDGERTLSLPKRSVEDALEPILRGTLEAAGVVDDDESVERVFRFSELTLVVTAERLVKHVGAAVWDADYEEFHYDDVTDLQFEEGSVATSVVLTLGDRRERFKTPSDRARLVREHVESALFSHHGVGSIEEFQAAVAPDEEDEDAPEGESAASAVDFGAGPEPLSTNPAELSEEPTNATATDERSADAAGEPVTGARTAGGDDGANGHRTEVAGGEAGFDGTGFAAPDENETQSENGDGDGDGESAAAPAADVEATNGANAAVIAELQALRRAVEKQSERIERQERLVEQLVEELRRGR